MWRQSVLCILRTYYMQTSHRITLQCNFTWGKLWTKALKIPLMFCCWPDLTFALLNLCPKYNRIITFLPFPEGSEKPNIVRFGKSFKLLKVCGVQEFYLTGEWKKSAQLGWVWLQWMSSVQRGTNSPKQKKMIMRDIFLNFFFSHLWLPNTTCAINSLLLVVAVSNECSMTFWPSSFGSPGEPHQRVFITIVITYVIITTVLWNDR